MLREIRLQGIGTDLTGWTGAIDPGTSRYPFANTPSVTLSEAWNDASLDTYAYNQGLYGPEHAMAFEPGPTLALFTAMRFEWSMDYSQEGPNNWWFPPDNAFGPTVGLLVRNRAQSAYISIYSYTFVTPGDDVHNTNVNVESPTPKEFTHTIFSHPEGGPWTLSDINHFAAGLSFSTSDGPNGKYADDPLRFQKFRAFDFRVYLTLQDLGGYVRSVRHNASATLRMKRRARSAISLDIPFAVSTGEVGDVVNIAHSRGADAEREGWGYKSQERRNGWLALRTYWPEALKVKDECYDLHPFNCEAWGAFRIPIAWTPELSGMAYLDQGGEWTLTRTQDAWSLRPGDGAALRVLEEYPNLSEEGMAIHSGGDEDLALWNVNLGNGVWTSATTGGASFTVQSNQPMADELGFYDSPLLAFGGTPGTASKSQDFALTLGDVVNVRARVRNVQVDTPLTKFLEVALFDGSGNYWNEDTRTWDASPVYNPIPSDKAFGEVIFDQVPIPATDTYTLQIGRMSGAINTASFVVAVVSMQSGAEYGTGMPLATFGTPITRVADVFEMANDAAFTFWHRDRGVAIVEFRPFWRADVMTAATTKRLVRADHAAGAYDEMRFSAGTGTAGADEFVVERSDTNGVQSIAIDIIDAAGAPLRLERGRYARVFYRWLDAEGWRKYAPHSVLIGYAIYNLDGTFVSYYESGATWLAPDASLEDVVTFSELDGWLRWFEIKRAPLSGTESVWRR